MSEELKQNEAQAEQNVQQPENEKVNEKVNEANEKVNVPSDAPGLEAVTVLIIGQHEPIARLSMQSVAKNLTGVDADIRLVRETDGDIVDLLQEVLETVSTERVILMTEQMMILNPVTLADIACVKDVRDGKTLLYDVPIPVMVYKSVLLQMLSETYGGYKGLGYLINDYFSYTLPDGFRPISLGDWRTSSWHLPVISENPKIDVLDKYCQWKKFGSFAYQSLGSAVMQYLKKRFANESHE